MTIQTTTGTETLPTNNLIFDRVVSKATNNKRLREEGKHVCIPFPFAGLSRFVPGIEKSNYYLLTGNQKSSKTQITDYLFVYNAYKFITERPTNIKLKIFHFNLEMDKESKIRQTIVHRLFLKKGIILSTRELDSVYEDRILPDELLRFIEQDREWFEGFESIVEYIDDIRNPFGIYNHVREFFEANGRYEYRTVSMRQKDGTFKDTNIIDRYIPNDPDLYVIILVDHLSLLLPEKGDTLFGAIGKLSSDYMVRARNRWGAIPVMIQQQSLERESNESMRMKTTEPSAAGLSDNKVTSKDCNIMLTIYNPLRNKLQEYLGYDIKQLRDNYRRIAVEFDRYGTTCETSLYFNGAVNFFKELPPSKLMTKELYDKVKRGEVQVN